MCIRDSLGMENQLLRAGRLGDVWPDLVTMLQVQPDAPEPTSP